MAQINQVIVNDLGHSWLGFWTSNEKFNNALNEILILTKSQNDIWFWVLDKDGKCVCTRNELIDILPFINTNRVLVHNLKNFIESF